MAGTSAAAACGLMSGLSLQFQSNLSNVLVSGPWVRAALANSVPAAAAAAAAAAASYSSNRTFSNSQRASAAASDALPADIAGASEGPAALYADGIKSGAYRPDPLQQITVQKLQTLYQDLRAAYPAPQKPSGLTMVDSVGATGSKSSSWFDSIGTLIKAQAGLHGQANPRGQRPHIKGLYMFGGVGCGKTMLMDLLVASAPKEFQVQRTHFHDFMLDIHGRLRHTKGEADPLKHVADDVAQGIKVLALDELFVTDVADAMILHRLFARLWDEGLVLVATSNRAPDALYENGLQRQLFLPFIHRLKEACVIHNMNSPVDYRRLAHHTRGIYFLTPDRTALLHKAFLESGEDSVTQGAVGHPGPVNLDVAMGRTLHVPQALGSAAMFDFDELCNRPLAAADYIALAEKFHTLAVADVPVFNAANRSAAYRFVTLIDVMYEHRVRMLISAEGTPFELFERILTQQDAHKAGGTTAGHISRSSSSHGSSSMQLHQHGFSSSSSNSSSDTLEAVVDDQLGFAKDRTISRLTEMQSIEYLIQHAKQRQELQHLVLALQEVQQKQRRQQQQH